MKALFVTLALIMVLSHGGQSSGGNRVNASGVVEDCGSPLLSKTVNPEAAPEGSDKLTEPTTHSTLNACKRLQGKKVCCSKAFMDKIGDKFNAIKEKFKARRKEQAQTLTRIEKDIEKNEDADAEMDAKMEAFKNDAFADADAEADKLQKETDDKAEAAKGKKVRLLSEEDTPKRRAKLMRLLGSLRFLGIRKLKEIEPKDLGDLKPGEGPNGLKPEGPIKPGGPVGPKEPQPEKPLEGPKPGEAPKPPNPEEEEKKELESQKKKEEEQKKKEEEKAQPKGVVKPEEKKPEEKAGNKVEEKKVEEKKVVVKKLGAFEKAEDKESTNAESMFKTLKSKDPKMLKGSKKFGRSAKDGGRPGTVDDADRNPDTGKQMTFKEMRSKYKPKITDDQKKSGKTTRDKSTYWSKNSRTQRTVKSKDDDKKTLKKWDPKDNDLKSKYNTKEKKVAYKKDYRVQFKAAVKKEYKEKLTTYKSNLKKQKDNLIKTQKRCFQAIMKFTAGSICLTCDAGYKKAGWLIPKAGSNNKVWQLKVKKGSCDRLKVVCFDYLQERTNVGQWLREAEQQVKKRSEYEKMKATIDEMEKCQDEEEFGCSSKKKDKMIDDASKVQEDNAKERTDKKKREEMMKKFQGGDKDASGKKKAPMSVKLPDGCTTKDDCNWICNKMAKASGADFDAIDMKDQESLDGETKYTEARRERILSGDDISLENSVVDDGSGYEPDSDENNEGLDASFSETVDSEVSDSDVGSSGTMYTLSRTIVFSLAAMMAILLSNSQ